MRKFLIVTALVALVVPAFLIPYYLREQENQSAIEFVKQYRGVHRRGSSISDYISLSLGCTYCGTAGHVSQSWRAEPTRQPNTWRVTVEAKTVLRTTELTFYTDLATVWPGDDEARRIINEVNAQQ
jgi:hypothetical protein